jgi:hypothetical protein
VSIEPRPQKLAVMNAVIYARLMPRYDSPLTMVQALFELHRQKSANLVVKQSPSSLLMNGKRYMHPEFHDHT